MLALLLACRADDPGNVPGDSDVPDGPPGSDATLAALDVGGPSFPAFDPDRGWYAAYAADVSDPLPVVATPTDPDASVVVRVEHVDGDDVTGLPALPDHRLVVEVTSADGTATRTYVVSLLPADFPEITADRTGEPSPGWYLLADFDFGAQPADIGVYAMAVDDAGVPGWWRRRDGPVFDVRVTADGRLSFVDEGLRGVVLDQEYDTASERSPVLVAPFDSVGGDPHEFAVQEDGSAWIVGTAYRTEDLSAWGGPAAGTVLHNVAQHLDADGALLWSWSTVDVVDYGALPAAVLQQLTMAPMFEPAHLNSIEIDPADGNPVISLRLPSRVVKVDAATGEILWSLGGPDSDFVFVDDDREGGWQGFWGQHSARMVGPDRLALFDNGTIGDDFRTGDARFVEYALDTVAWTATRVTDFSLPDSDQSPAGGSVQRLADGHTVIGWGMLQVARGGKAPVLTELDADGNVVLELTLPENLWTYRAWKAEGDPLSGAW